MSDRFLIRQLANLALTANATRPLPGERASVPAFFAGWLTAELAPHLLAVTAADTLTHVARRGLSGRGDKLALAAAATSAVGYARLMGAGQHAGNEVEDALREALGDGYRDELATAPTPADLATPWRRLINPFRMADVNVVAHRRLPYAPGGKRFELDVYTHRDAPANAPVLFQVHGGAWMIGHKQQQGIPLMMHMAARGWVCVAANYPLSPRAKWPEHLIALKRAMQWIREHAGEYGADPSFVAVTGGSAGGHLAAMLALTPNDKSLQPGFQDVDTSVQACVPHYGMYDFTADSGRKYTQARIDSLLRRYVMSPDAVYPDDYRAASPICRITADAPPFFVIHGTNDTLIPVADARDFVAKLREISREPVAYAEIRGAQHAFDIFPSIRSAHVVRGVQRFLDVCFTRAVARGSAPRPV
ncbi:MAG TPA: alpha/beta hydrolase [Jatrophihabitantaceae bacterium]|jgi:acetyl esterase/lipase|nr:alpha/beta hydrolase [Jatrophihabitantaceae bacterium]